MALLNKLFSSRRKSSCRSSRSGDFLETGWRPPTFTKDQIRVLVFRECEVRGRKLLFDWKSVRKTQAEKPSRTWKNSCPRSGSSHSSTFERSDGLSEVAHNGIVYQYLRPKSDVRMLGEMVFGSVAMSYKGVTIKIHHIRVPPQLMFCKVFPSPGASSDSDGCSSLTNSISDYLPKRPGQGHNVTPITHSVPMDVPPLLYEDNLDLMTSSSLRSNGSFGSSHSCHQGSPESSTNSLDSLTRSGSYNSLQRRWTRSLNTSMEFGLRRMSSDSVSSKEEQYAPNSRRTKLGISVVISLSENEDEERHFQTFFFSHIALIEGYLNKLSNAVSKAYVNRRQFVHLVMEGVENLQQCLFDLYTAPRLPDPVWLSMMAPGAQQHKLCLRFMTEFMRLLELYDNKNTKYFVSTLLTAVLTHHLAWVSTVTPSGILPSQSLSEKRNANWLDQLAKFQPYNPLWVQLCDLYGAVGTPFKVAKTVVVGENADLVRRLLYCLTYFVRCSEVYENVQTRLLSPVEKHNSQSNAMIASASSTSSAGTLVGEVPTLTPTVLAEVAPEVRRRRSIETINEGVERQEGEGDETEDDDEVFEGTEDKDLLEVQERTPKNGSIDKSRRHGVIYESSMSMESTPIVNAEGHFTFDEPTIEHLTNTQTAVVTDVERDSGFVSYVDHVDGATSTSDECKTPVIVDYGRIVSCTEENESKPTPKARRRKGASGKVVFTIGNIPLRDMCGVKFEAERIIANLKTDGSQATLAREQSPTEEPLVCTCGKHVAAGVLGGVVVRPRQSLCVGDSSDCFVDGTTFSDELALTLDSGIHSCEGSDLDLATEPVNELGERKTSVSVLDMLPPPVRLEHERSLGKSHPRVLEAMPEVLPSPLLKSCTSDTDLCRLAENVCIKSGEEVEEDHGNDLPSPRERQLVAPHNRADKTALWNLCFERSNSMFDEYFDDNVELKMLDDDSFRERIQSRCQKPREPTPDQEDQEVCGGGLTPRPALKRFDRNGLLDSRDSERSCGYDDGVRTVLWNSDPPPPLSPPPTADSEDFFDRAVFMQLPKSDIKQTANSTKDYQRGFGWSLTSNFADHYMSDFALQGTPDSKFGSKLSDDLRNDVQHPVLDENIVEAVSIVADTNKWTVEVVSDRQGVVSESGAPIGVRVTTSQLVVGMTESLLQLWKLKMSPEFCLMHLEDRLQEFFFKSCLLADYFRDTLPLDVQHVSSALDLDSSDLPLLLAICLTHSPEVPCTFGISYR